MARAFPEKTMVIEGHTYRVVLDINAQVLLEERLGMTFQEVVDRVMKNNRTHERWLFWASLQRHHSDITLAQAGDLMSAAVDVPEAMAGSLSETLPDPDDLKALGVKPSKRPRKAPTA